jgi:hypothetical protein
VVQARAGSPFCGVSDALVPPCLTANVRLFDMMLSVEDIEKSFGATFQAMEPGPGSVLHHFDGYAHWSVLYMEDHLYISADSQIGGSAFPVVELTAYCSRVSTSSAGGVGPTLILHPNDTGDMGRLVVLTKTKQGRISLCTSVGAGPDCRKTEPGASPNGGPAEPLGNSGVGGGPPSVS